MIRAGELRERVAVMAYRETKNQMGEMVPVYDQTFATVWASVEGVTARELLLAGQQQTEISHRVRMRYLPGLTQQMRIVWRDRTLEIISVLEHENRSIHELICQETT
jgi:SPP1 family predicted phage head-tail adaptor